MMRMSYLVLVLVLVAGLTSMAQAGKKDKGGSGGLSAAEVAGLLEMREEEKLARDVYITLGQKWDVPIFSNIAESEQRHMDSVKGLLDKYGLEDPAAGNEIGEFTAPKFIELYAQLIAQGEQSLEEAYKVGVAIEELDIDDLEHLLKKVTHSDIRRVYNNLLDGSYNHLAAFQSKLD